MLAGEAPFKAKWQNRTDQTWHDMSRHDRSGLILTDSSKILGWPNWSPYTSARNCSGPGSNNFLQKKPHFPILSLSVPRADIASLSICSANGHSVTRRIIICHYPIVDGISFPAWKGFKFASLYSRHIVHSAARRRLWAPTSESSDYAVPIMEPPHDDGPGNPSSRNQFCATRHRGAHAMGPGSPRGHVVMVARTPTSFATG